VGLLNFKKLFLKFFFVFIYYYKNWLIKNTFESTENTF
jgi:hypothetical protein